jgi:glycosyltransferase A (GT-A) superfamily protein (DUF2064 family)
MMVQLLVLAKTPLPGRVKTRLCPPCTPAQAAEVAAAALADTLDAVTATPCAARTLVVDGGHPAPAGWSRVPQRGSSLGERLAHAYADTIIAGMSSLLIGMDTPQVNPALLTSAADQLAAAETDAVLGLAEDGGWWVLGPRNPLSADVLSRVPTSMPDTGALTLDALRSTGLRVATLPVLRDVDTAADARAVAELCPGDNRFPLVVSRAVPSGVAA